MTAFPHALDGGDSEEAHLEASVKLSNFKGNNESEPSSIATTAELQAESRSQLVPSQPVLSPSTIIPLHVAAVKSLPALSVNSEQSQTAAESREGHASKSGRNNVGRPDFPGDWSQGASERTLANREILTMNGPDADDVSETTDDANLFQAISQSQNASLAPSLPGRDGQGTLHRIPVDSLEQVHAAWPLPAAHYAHSANSYHSQAAGPYVTEWVPVFASHPARPPLSRDSSHARIVFARHDSFPEHEIAMQPSSKSVVRTSIELRLHQDPVANRLLTMEGTFLNGIRQQSKRLVFGNNGKNVAESAQGDIMPLASPAALCRVSWYEGTSTAELWDYVRQCIRREINLDPKKELYNIRVLDDSINPAEGEYQSSLTARSSCSVAYRHARVLIRNCFVAIHPRRIIVPASLSNSI
jgi:hypothetical protein